MLGARHGPDLLPKGFCGASLTARETTVITDCPVGSVILILHVLLSASGMKWRTFSIPERMSMDGSAILELLPRIVEIRILLVRKVEKVVRHDDLPWRAFAALLRETLHEPAEQPV